MTDWREFPLSDVAWFQEGPGILAKDFREIGVPLVRLSGLGGHQVTLKGCNFVDPLTTRWQHFQLQGGDILVSTSASFGRPAIVGKEAAGAIFYTGLIRFRSKTAELDNNYLKHFLGSRHFSAQAEAMASGSVIRHFGPSHLKQMSIRIPPKAVQIQIARFADALDDKIELNRRMNETLEAMAQAIFRDWFVDFGPTRRKLAGTTDPVEIMGGLTSDPTRAAELAALFPPAFADDGLPSAWERKRVDEIASRVAMGPFGSNITKDNFVSDGVPVIRGKNLGSGFIDDDFVFLTPKKAASLSNSAAKQGDIVFTHRGTLGQVGRIYVGARHDTYIASQSQLVLSIDRAKASPIAVYQFFRSEEGQRAWLANAGGAGVPAIGRPTASLKEITITVPCPAVSKEYEAIVGLLERRQVSALREASALTQLRDLLLPKLMSGEIRLRDAEAIAEAAR